MPRPRSRAFIGRVRELADLAAGYDALAASPVPTFTLVSGDAGTGKTFLLEELVAVVESAGGLALVGWCVQVGDFGLPYLPVIDALRAVEADPVGAEILRAESAVRPALARLLPHLLPDELDRQPSPTPEASTQGQLFEALLRVLAMLSTSRPVLLVIEDAHWADRSTRDLIAFLARTLRQGRVAVVVSYRSDDLHRRHPLRQLLAELARLPHIRRVPLGPFSRPELALMLDELAGSPVDAQLVDRIFARSEGNAFFAEELIRAGQAGRGRLPDDLADVLLNRVEGLGTAALQAVRAAAVAGRRVGHDLLVAAADADDTEDGLRQAVESGLLTRDRETYTFRHALIQEAVYGDLLPGERVRLHARFAELLAGGGDDCSGPGELAHHRLASHDLPGALAASIEAAGAAESMAAPADALRHLEQAVGLLDRLGNGADRLQLQMRAAEVASASGDTARAVAFGRAAVAAADERPEDVATRAATRERLARLQLDADVDADETSRQALELLADRPSALLARALATRARAVLRTEDPAVTAQMLALATRMAGDTGADVIAADALITLNLMVRRGFLPSVAAPLLADTLGRTTGPEALDVRVRALRFQASQLMEDGDLDGALAAANQGVALTTEAGLRWSPYGLDLRLMRGWVLAATGNWDEVLAESLGAVYAPTEPGRVLATQAVAVMVGRGAPEAEALLARLRGTGDNYADIQLDLSEMDLRLAQGRPHDAVAIARVCRARLSAESGGTERLLLAARHAAALADLAAAARSAGKDGAAQFAAAAAEIADEAEGIPMTPALNGPHGRSALLRVRAEADRAAGTHTSTQWESVHREARRAGRVQEQVYAATAAARVLLEEGDRDGAAAVLRPALVQAQLLRADPMVTAIVDLARRGRLQLSPDHAQRSRLSLLTAREAEVLALVADGLSNRRVGEILFISEKTASVHLSHIMAKLGASTRTEAVSLARQQGLLLD